MKYKLTATTASKLISGMSIGVLLLGIYWQDSILANISIWLLVVAIAQCHIIGRNEPPCISYAGGCDGDLEGMDHINECPCYNTHARNPIYCAIIDEVPSLSLTAHEICDPGELTSEEIVTMWDTLKHKYEELKSKG